ncbi:MAG: thioredoxin family protein [Thiotrichaceae bacterium]
MQKINKLTQFDYYHLIESMQSNALVYYTSPACGSCRHLRKALEHYLQTYDDLQIFEVDAVHEVGLVQSFEVFHLPSMFLYQSGKFHCELHCEAHPVKIHKAIAAALLNAPEEEP